jgi:UPF0755 protein
MKHSLIRIKSVHACISTLLAFFVMSLLVAYSYSFGPSLYDSKYQEHIIIEPTDSLYIIAQRLEERRLIVSAFAFQVAYSFIAGNTPIVSGAYELSPSQDAWSIAREFMKSPHHAWVEIPVGYRLEQVSAILSETLEWSSDDIENFKELSQASSTFKLDGIFLPGIYLIEKKSAPQTVVSMFYTRVSDLYRDILQTSVVKNVSLSDALIIASLIQKEAAGKSDRNLVSGIIHNRLEKNMKLQIDATLQYIKGYEGDWWQTPYSEDKYLESPYNTYTHTGLPPGPISNASIETLKAALNPQLTSCLFYLHDPKARIHCSATYAGHLSNIDAHLR